MHPTFPLHPGSPHLFVRQQVPLLGEDEAPDSGDTWHYLLPQQERSEKSVPTLWPRSIEFTNGNKTHKGKTCDAIYYRKLPRHKRRLQLADGGCWRRLGQVGGGWSRLPEQATRGVFALSLPSPRLSELPLLLSQLELWFSPCVNPLLRTRECPHATPPSHGHNTHTAGPC